MNNKSIKFIIVGLIVVGAISYLAFSGFQESKAYFMHVSEVRKKGKEALGLRLKMHGTVKKGTIRKMDKEIKFVLEYEGKEMPVLYNGSAIVPDTFKDGTEAVVSGKLKNLNLFEANHIQAKCASKYEPDYKKLKKNG